MSVDAALVQEQGVTFAVVVVKPHMLASAHQRDEAITGFQPYWPGTPIILMAQDSHGVPKYYGRDDIVRFLTNVPMEILPWKSWKLN